MRKHTAVKWTRERAASEFGINPRTLVNRLRRNGIKPDANGEFSTRQICAAVFGDIDGEKLRLCTEQADKLAMENQVSRGELVRVTELVTVLGKTVSAMKQRILGATQLLREEKTELINDLHDLIANAKC